MPYLIGRDFDFRRDGSRWRRTRDPDTAPSFPLPPFGGEEQFANAASCAAVVDCARRVSAGHGRGAGGRHRERVSCAAAWSGTPSTASSGYSTSATIPRRPRCSRRRCGACRPPAALWVVFAAMRDKDLAGVVAAVRADGRPVGSSRRRARIAARPGAELGTLLESLGAARIVVADDVAAACAAARTHSDARRSRRRLRIVPSRWEPRSKRFGYTAQPPHWLTDPPHGSGFEGTTRRRGRVGRDCGVADSLGARRSGSAARDERQLLQLPAAEEPMPMRTQTLRLGDAAEPSAEPPTAAVQPPVAEPAPRRGAARRSTAANAAQRAKATRLRSPPSGRSRSARPLRPRRRRLPRAAAETGARGRSDGRLDRSARQLQRGSQCAAARAARRHVRLQGRGRRASRATVGRYIAYASGQRRSRAEADATASALKAHGVKTRVVAAR